MDFAVLVKYQFEGEPVSSVLLGAVNSVGVGATASITKQPMVDGDEVSDHMFRQGKTLNISGECSLNGDDGIVLSGGKSKLANLQELFERIQSEGIMCDVFKISTKNEEDIRFLQRTNMVLNNIQWNENINSLDYTFSFTQALLAEVVQYDVDPNDTSLPDPSTPVTSSFTDSIINWEDVDASVVKVLLDEKLLTEEFIRYVGSILGKAAIGVTLAVGIAALAIAVCSNPVGWVIGAVALGGLAVYGLVKGIISSIKKAEQVRKYKIEAFEYTKSDEKNRREAERFIKFFEEFHEEIKSIDKLFHCYQISVDAKTECMVNIGSDYYCFCFSDKNPNNGSRSVTAYSMQQEVVGTMSDISSCITDISQANNGNTLFIANNNAKVYIVNPTDNKQNLTNYYIMVCDFDPTKYDEILTKILQNYIYA